MKLQSPKGFKDYLPKEALKRKFVVEKITEVFEKFGFDPLETPSLEYEETLTGKYGEEEKLIYKFETPGGDKVALKYDQTVPLARVVAQYGPRGEQTLPIPFKRYQIQSAFRGENTQKGRYREFLQCDADIIGVSSPLADAEILACVYKIYEALGLEILIKINDRSLFERYNISVNALSTIDKLNKIGEEGVLKQLQTKGFSPEQAVKILKDTKALKASVELQQIIALYEKLGCPKDSIKFEETLVRGLDYYTGMIFEVVLKSDPTSASLCGGGRWDQMIGKFTGLDLPAVGFAIGLDRTIEALEEEGVLDVDKTNTKVLVTVFSPELKEKSVEVTSKLRTKNIPAELWLDDSKLDKQFKYADTKGIPYVIVIGPDEAKENLITLKDLNSNTQKKISLEEIIEKLSII